MVAVYGANILIAAHFYLVIYINSTTLGRFFSDQQVGFFFILGALISVILFLITPKLLRRHGVFHYFLGIFLLECIAIIGLAFYDSKIGTVLFFLVHQASVPMLTFSLDVLFETTSKDEKETGELRGLYITIASLMLVIAPSIVGLISQRFPLQHVYALSLFFLFPLLLISFTHLRKIHTTAPKQIDIAETLKDTWKKRDLRYGILAHFILQFFYAWMVIYLPLYLTQIIGFTWAEIGMLFTIMLLPFLLFEVPVGWLADKKLGEKELMISGFSIMAIVTACFLIPTTASFWTWAVLLFLSRVGASIAEITTESYFFKHTKGKNADLISIFRVTRPISYLFAPMIAILALSFMDLGQAFWVLSIVTASGALFAFEITDTR